MTLSSCASYNPLSIDCVAIVAAIRLLPHIHHRCSSWPMGAKFEMPHLHLLHWSLQRDRIHHVSSDRWCLSLIRCGPGVEFEKDRCHWWLWLKFSCQMRARHFGGSSKPFQGSTAQPTYNRCCQGGPWDCRASHWVHSACSRSSSTSAASDSDFRTAKGLGFICAPCIFDWVCCSRSLCGPILSSCEMYLRYRHFGSFWCVPRSCLHFCCSLERQFSPRDGALRLQHLWKVSFRWWLNCLF